MKRRYGSLQIPDFVFFSSLEDWIWYSQKKTCPYRVLSLDVTLARKDYRCCCAHALCMRKSISQSEHEPLANQISVSEDACPLQNLGGKPRRGIYKKWYKSESISTVISAVKVSYINHSFFSMPSVAWWECRIRISPLVEHKFHYVSKCLLYNAVSE